MNTSKIKDGILESKVVTIIRTDFPQKIYELTKILLEVGLPVLEVTSNTPNFLDVIYRIRTEIPDAIIGAGTITNTKLAREAMQAGALFLVTPNTSKDVLDCAKLHNTPIAMGAFTPTEVHKLAHWEADFIKLFPADFLGPNYLKAIMATLGDVKIIPTGGVGLADLPKWMDSGASAFGIGSGIVSRTDLANDDFENVRRKAQSFKNALKHYI